MNQPTRIGIARRFHDDILVQNKLSSLTSLIAISENAIWETDICLFRLPEYLRRRWWDVVAPDLLDENAESSNFYNFLENFKDFAFFKNMPLSMDLEFNILVRAPNEQCRINNEMNIVGIINLGDEQSTVVIKDELVTLEAGDGCWAPKASSIQLSDTSAKSDVDVLFVISSSGQSDSLQKGVGIYNYIAGDSLSHRVSLSGGVCLARDVDKTANYVESAYVPLLPWRNPNQAELNKLFITKLPDTLTNAIGLLRIPPDIIEQFTALKLFEVCNQAELLERMSTEAGKLAIRRARQYVWSLTLNDNDLETKIIYNQPNLLTTTHLPGEYKYIGLHIDYTHQQSIFTRKQSSNRISINLSNEDRYFLFINLPVTNIIRLLNPPSTYTTDELAREFFETFPNYPVVKIRVAPGEAYIAPTQNIIHDGIGPKQSPDIHLTFCGYLDLHKVSKGLD